MIKAAENLAELLLDWKKMPMKPVDDIRRRGLGRVGRILGKPGHLLCKLGVLLEKLSILQTKLGNLFFEGRDPSLVKLFSGRSHP